MGSRTKDLKELLGGFVMPLWHSERGRIDRSKVGSIDPKTYGDFSSRQIDRSGWNRSIPNVTAGIWRKGSIDPVQDRSIWVEMIIFMYANVQKDHSLHKHTSGLTK